MKMKTILEHLSHNSHSSSNSKVYFELQLKDGNSILLHLSRVICTIRRITKFSGDLINTYSLAGTSGILNQGADPQQTLFKEELQY